MTSSTPDPSELHGLDPGELLARGMNTVRPSGGALGWTPPTPEEAARMLPQYRIEKMLGRGGMGAVYKGLQDRLDRAVAIKILPAELSADAQFVTRFEREARTLARLQHPGIVAVYDFGQTSDGHLYFVMEYVEGTDLNHILQGPGLEPGQALEIITQICEALHAAHNQGVIHRDIKPANILLTTDGRVKLADFGLARPHREEHEALTLSNIAVGTPDYMAPEQRDGQSDLRADIYALGVMLYEMLTGQLPRGAWAPPSRKVQVDVRIDEVVLKALQQEPDLRYQQASEMKTDVESIRSNPSAPPPIVKPRRRWIGWAALVATIALAATVAVWIATKSRSNAVPGEEPVPAWLNLGQGIRSASPVWPDTLLREIEYMPSESGLKKFVYTPVKPDYGLILRWSCRPEFMEGYEREMGFDQNTVFECVHAPGEGWDNTLVLVKGSTSVENSFLIWLSQALDADEEGDKTIVWLEKLPYLNLDRELFDDRAKLAFTRSSDPDSAPPYLTAEIVAVPYEEIKRKYPEMRDLRNTQVYYVGGKPYFEEVHKFQMAKSAASRLETAAKESADSGATPSPPDPQEQYRRQAYEAALRGDAAESKAWSEKAIALNPDFQWNWVTSGWCLFNLDLPSEALAAWEKAYQLDPNAYGRINVCLAMAYDQTGDLQKALHFYSEQVKLDSAFAQRRTLLDTTRHWQPKEKKALEALYGKWAAAKAAGRID